MLGPRIVKMVAPSCVASVLSLDLPRAILEARATEQAMAQCAAEFKSFDARTVTYVMRAGEVRFFPVS